MHTDGSGEHEYHLGSVPVSGKDSLLFRLKACSEAYLTLTEIEHNPHLNSYEVALGINGGSGNELRHKAGGSVQAEHSETLLHCDETRHFWVSWISGSIEFGKGDSVGSEMLLQWNHDTPYDINAVALATKDSVKGIWEFTSTTGIKNT